MSALAFGINQKLLYPCIIMRFTDNIAAAIRANDLPAYQRERYPAIQEGEIVRFIDEGFSGVDFDQFVMGFFVFQNCNLDSAKHIYGQPIYFINSSVRNVDFCGVKVIIEAKDCDFRGMKYDKGTQFVYGSGELAARSRFVSCRFDEEARGFLMRQGVEIISYDKQVKL